MLYNYDPLPSQNSSWGLIWYEEFATNSSMTQPVNDALHFCVWLQSLSDRPYPFDIVMCLVFAVPLTQIFPMRHRSDGMMMLLLSVHTTCHRRCQAKVAVIAVVWGFPTHHKNGKRHCHSLTIYLASKTYCTICTRCAVPTSRFSHPLYTQSTDGRLSWS